MSAATVTKSIRLLPEEAQEVARISEQMAVSEAALMKQWIREGLRAQKIDLAIHHYMQREVDLRSGAALAGVSYNRFLREVQARNVVVLAEGGFLDRVAHLASLLDDDVLGAAVQSAMGQPEDDRLSVERDDCAGHPR
jgi:predicted HTH domain antitoxin